MVFFSIKKINNDKYWQNNKNGCIKKCPEVRGKMLISGHFLSSLRVVRDVAHKFLPASR